MGPTAAPRPGIAFAGEPGSFAEDAGLVAYPSFEPVPVPVFHDVVEAVAGGRVAAGVLPIENVVGGTVREVYDLLLDAETAIIGEVIVPVRLCLAALPGQRMEDIERVYSHIQALGQAEAFLRTRPWALLASTNTAGAGRMIAERGERAAAAVLSPRAADLFGLEVLAADIQSEARNRTRFLVIARPDAVTALPPAACADPRGLRRTTLALSVRNEPGTLHRVLGVLARHDLNMSKLESRPSREGTWEYVFWIDLDSDLCVPGGPGRRVLDDLRRVSVWVRVMGCYARSTEPAAG